VLAIPTSRKGVRMSSVAPAVDVRLKSVLIAFDFSEASHKPLRHAIAIARHYGAKFYLAHVVSSIGFAIAGAEALQLAYERALRDAHQLEHGLLQDGSLAGLDHRFIVSEGDVWDELHNIIAAERIELVVLGTHGRRGLGKLLLGSVAERICRQADCLVLTVGPWSFRDARLELNRPNRSFLFATDFGEASLKALPFAISSANHFEARLILLHVVPPVPLPGGPVWVTSDDVAKNREETHISTLRRLEELAKHADLKIEPQFVVEHGWAVNVSEKILTTAESLTVDAIIMGLHKSTHIGTASHMPGATAYEVVCRAGCPVLTVRS